MHTYLIDDVAHERLWCATMGDVRKALKSRPWAKECVVVFLFDLPTSKSDLVRYLNGETPHANLVAKRYWTLSRRGGLREVSHAQYLELIAE